VADDTHVVLADPGGNRLCVIEPGNNYLAGTGHLAEVTSDGTRPSACSGAMCSAGRWCGTRTSRPQSSRRSAVPRSHGTPGGTEDEPKKGRNRQRFDLVSADPPARRNDLSPAERSVFPTCLTESLTPTATNSACTECER